ncbi:MAG: iron-sulfur cluster repair di-iron protein [Deltaproteobacteria bacterium]|nr:iron-sulfur cluster repair di-iron protein [Deltaproteobacteria bacterium]
MTHLIHTNDTLASLATAHPEATTVFLRHQLDFCCGGGRKLSDACATLGLDPAKIVAEIAAEQAPHEVIRWDKRPVEELVEHILTRYHAPLRRELSGLLEAAKKIERVHAAKPSCPHGLAAHLAQVATELEEHMTKEEQVLFPALRSGARGQAILMPVRVMMREHDDHGANLRKMRDLATDFVPPPEACATWRALYVGLAKLEGELMEHIHLENNVLFVKALAH